jgi:5,10-methenyltetrahydrofolate synthetase
MIDSKQTLRKEIIASRLEVPMFELARKSARIISSLYKVYPWEKAKTLHVYESIDELKEINTKSFIARTREQYPGLEIYTARKINNEWTNVSLDNKPASNIEFDVVIVPMLGFDTCLNRLGYGSGYYDKFLSMQAGTTKIGLCLELGRTQTLPVESYDIAMDLIISEKQIYSLNSIL